MSHDVVCVSSVVYGCFCRILESLNKACNLLCYRLQEKRKNSLVDQANHALSAVPQVLTSQQMSLFWAWKVLKYRIRLNKRPCPNKRPSPYCPGYRADFPEHASF